MCILPGKINFIDFSFAHYPNINRVNTKVKMINKHISKLNDYYTA